MQLSYHFEWGDLIYLAVVAGMALIFATVRYFQRKNDRVDAVDRLFVKNQFKKIEQLLELHQEMNYKLAVIEADKILEDVLRSMYFPGNTTSERLKVASYKYPRLRKVWWAHKVRNMCVHDIRYVIKYTEAQKVVGLFRDALKELDVL